MNGQWRSFRVGQFNSGLHAALLAAALLFWLCAPVAGQSCESCATTVALDESGWRPAQAWVVQPAVCAGSTSCGLARSAGVCLPATAEAPAPANFSGCAGAWRPVGWSAAIATAPVVPAGWNYNYAVPAAGPQICALAAPSCGAAPGCGTSAGYGAAPGYYGGTSWPAICPVAYAGASPWQAAYAGPNVVYRPAVPRFVLPGGTWTNRPLVIKPKVYVPGQPVRNLLRSILP